MSLHTATLPDFAPPGNLNELTSENKQTWSSQYISKWMNDEIAGNNPGRSPLSQFFNGTVTPFDVSQSPARIQWIAFPNKVSNAIGHTWRFRSTKQK